MENNNNEQQEYIDLREVFKKILSRKALYIKTICITFVLACAWILPQPRSYTSEVTLAPEMENIAGGGGLMDIASSFGFDLGGGNVSDAIYPTLYPDLLESSGFIVKLFGINVKNMDGDIDEDYYTYLFQHQKKNIYTWPFRWIMIKVKNMMPKKPRPIIPANGENGEPAGPNPFCLSERETAIVALIRKNIKCDVDIKTNVITISVTDQDPLICACIADSVRVRLQDYITQYRTNKARIDVEYYEKLTNEAKAKYDESCRRYSNFIDANVNLTRPSLNTKKTEMEEEMQLLYNSYTTFKTQHQTALAKLQERTPSFTVIQCASVPIKAEKPKRMLFVLGMMFLAFMGTTLYIFKDSITQQLMAGSKQ